jgi:DNA modification methylase
MTAPYWTDGHVTLYHGDCRIVTEWLTADVLVTDPPYGIGWSKPELTAARNPAAHDGIAGDADTSVRDAALAAWGASRPALVFGSLRAPFPVAWKRMLVFRKPVISVLPIGNEMPWFANWEPVFALGQWPRQKPSADAVISTRALTASGYSGYATRYGHPHAKPVDVMETLIAACPAGVIADPFAGSGSSLIAARNQGRRAIGVEVDEPYCEMAARRLSQGVLVAEEPVA